MKNFLNCGTAILSVCLGAVTSFPGINNAYALEEGFYWGGGSRYIQIAKGPRALNGTNRDRICYQGFSTYGTRISSLELITPNQPNSEFIIYFLHGNTEEQTDPLAVVQSKYQSDQIIFGKFSDISARNRRAMQYRLDANASSASFKLTPELQACLDSDQPYHQQILSNRDRR